MDFSTLLIPKDSVAVKEAAAQAYTFSQKETFVESHLYATAYATKAVAISFFSTFSYFVRSFGHLVTQGADLNFKGLVIDFAQDNLYALQSLSLSVLGVFYIASALFLPKAAFSHFSVEHPKPPRDFQMEVHNLTLQNQQLGGALYVQSQTSMQTAFTLQTEREARNTERTHAKNTIDYLTLETNRLGQEKAQEVNQRGYLEYQYSLLAAAKAQAENQIILTRQQLFNVTQEKAQADAKIAKLTHDKAQANLQIGVYKFVIGQHKRENKQATERIADLTTQKALAEIFLQHTENVLSYRTHERNVQTFTANELAHEKILTGFELTDLKNQLAYKTHERNVASFKLGQLTQENALANIQLTDLENRLTFKTHEKNIADFHLAQLTHDNAQLRAGNAQVATLQADLHASEARVLAATTDLGIARHQKGLADAQVARITHEKSLVEDQVRQLTNDNAQLQAGNAQVATLQHDLRQAELQIQQFRIDLADQTNLKQQAEARILVLQAEVGRVELERNDFQARLAAEEHTVAGLRVDIAQAADRVRVLGDDIAQLTRDKAGLEVTVRQLTDEKNDALTEVRTLTADIAALRIAPIPADPQLAQTRVLLQEQVAKVAALNEEIRVAKLNLDAAELAVRRTEGEKEQITLHLDRVTRDLATETLSKQDAERRLAEITVAKDTAVREKDVADTEIARIQGELEAANQAHILTQRAKILSERTLTAEKDALTRQVADLRAGQERLQALLALRPIKDVATVEQLTAVLTSMQKADLTRDPMDIPIFPIIHEIDNQGRAMHHNVKDTLEASFTTAATTEANPLNQVLLFVDDTKYTNGDPLYRYLSVHSPDKESKKAFPLEVLGMVHARQHLLDGYTLPILKEKFDIPNLGLTIEPANSPVTIKITTNDDRAKPALMTIEKNYLLKRHGDLIGQTESAHITGTLTFTLYKPKHEGLVGLGRRVENPQEKANFTYKITEIKAAVLAVA